MDTLFPLDDAAAAKPALSLRPYQRACRDTVLDSLPKDGGRGLVIAATGTGKTEIGVEIIRAFGKNALFISPLIELVSQTASRLRSRGLDCGIEQGVLKSHSGVTVASYASLLSRDRYQRFVDSVKTVIVDEVHLNYTRRALQMLDDFSQAGALILGMTASPERGTGDPLVKYYQRVLFDYGIRTATDDGWLVPSKVWLSVIEDMDLSQCHRAFGDYNAEQLATIMARERVVQGVCSLVEQHYEGEPSVVFCHSIHQSEQIVEVLGRRGIEASIVHSRMDADERRMHLSRFENGITPIICNVGVLTLGWDHPPVRRLFIAKPTKSKAKYVQMYGRGTRPLPGVVDGYGTPEQRKQAIADSRKPMFEVFDITDTARHNDLITAVDVLSDAPPEVLRRSKLRTEKAGGVTPKQLDEIIQAEREAEAREQAARDALEASRRANLVVNARFGIYERDPYAAAEEAAGRGRVRRWHMLFGKHKGKPLTDIPTGYLQWVVRESNCRNRQFLDACAREVSRRQ